MYRDIRGKLDTGEGRDVEREWEGSSVEFLFISPLLPPTSKTEGVYNGFEVRGRRRENIE